MPVTIPHLPLSVDNILAGLPAAKAHDILDVYNVLPLPATRPRLLQGRPLVVARFASSQIHEDAQMLKDFVDDFRSRRAACTSSSSNNNFKSADNWSRLTANASKADNWSNFNEMIDPVGVASSDGSSGAEPAVQPMGITPAEFSSFIANAKANGSATTYFQSHRNAVHPDAYQVAFLKSVHDETRISMRGISPERTADQISALVETIAAVQAKATGSSVDEHDAITIYSAATITNQSEQSSRSMSRRWLRKLAEDSSTPAEALRLLAIDTDNEVRCAVADHKNTPIDALWLLKNDTDADVRYALAENHNVMLELLETLTEDDNPYVASRAARTIRRLQGGIVHEFNFASNHDEGRLRARG